MGGWKTNRRTLAEQVGALKSYAPPGQIKLAKGGVTWIGVLQPTPLSRAFTVKVYYRLGAARAEITILEPALESPSGVPIPHTFKGNHPCVHFPPEWHSGMLLASTVIPWTSLWLLFYEAWLATDEWLGGGHEPVGGKSP